MVDLEGFRKRLRRSGRVAIEKEFESLRQTGAVNKKRSRSLPIHFVFSGGPEEIRTLDLSDANRTLSQLSYRPKYSFCRLEATLYKLPLTITNYICRINLCQDLFHLVRQKKLRAAASCAKRRLKMNNSEKTMEKNRCPVQGPWLRILRLGDLRRPCEHLGLRPARR